MALHSSTLAWWAAVHGVAKSQTLTERLHFHFSLSCIGEENGNPLQCPCLENSRDHGAWWAAICGVAQSWIRLKQLSSSSSNHNYSVPFNKMGEEDNKDCVLETDRKTRSR